MKSINDRFRVGMDVGTTGSSIPKLIARWFIPQLPNLNGTSGELRDLPDDAKWCRVYGVGAGGGVTNTSDNGGAGGDFAVASFAMDGASGDYFGYFVGAHNPSAQGGDTFLTHYRGGGSQGATRIFAGGGRAGTSSGPGQSRNPASFGDFVAPGASGASQQGGNSGNDYSSASTLNLGGTGASPFNAATGKGGGAATRQTSPGVVTTYPGTQGVMVIEFWSGDPR